MGPLVSTEWLAAHLSDPDLVVADVRWYPGRPDGAREAYAGSHVAGAVFVDIDHDLADRSDLSKGRHPLPHPQAFVDALARLGIGEGTRVVAYDDAGGAIAARLWWMMRWIGGGPAAVLDGGLPQWRAEGRAVESGPPAPRARAARPLAASADWSLVADKAEVARALREGVAVVDARAGERFRGEVEPIDKHAGHIAGAMNAPYPANLTGGAASTFRDPQSLRARFAELGLDAPAPVICYCGSGVSACHNVLAMVVAGLPMPRLYPGSWSEWSQDPSAPVATGPA